MGRPMAARLLAAGFNLQIWNRSSAAAHDFQGEVPPDQRKRLRVAATAAEAVSGADVSISMLSDGPAVRAVLFGAANQEACAEGVARHLKAGSVWLDMSSIPPETARQHAQALAELGVTALDAPVSGGVVGAAAGTLAIMVGGDAGVMPRLAPVFAALGRVTPVGPAGAGQLAKLANQVIVGVTIGAVAEALLLAARGGADAEAVRAAIRGGFAESRILELHGARMLEDTFAPGGAVQTQLKDLRTALAAAEAAGLDLPITALLAELFADAVEAGDGNLDHAALLREIGRRNGLPANSLLRPPH